MTCPLAILSHTCMDYRATSREVFLALSAPSAVLSSTELLSKRPNKNKQNKSLLWVYRYYYTKPESHATSCKASPYRTQQKNKSQVLWSKLAGAGKQERSCLHVTAHSPALHSKLNTTATFYNCFSLRFLHEEKLAGPTEQT